MVTEVRLSPHQKILCQWQQICQSKDALGSKVLFNFVFVLPSRENKYAKTQDTNLICCRALYIYLLEQKPG